jgi:hypothetical protein
MAAAAAVLAAVVVLTNRNDFDPSQRFSTPVTHGPNTRTPDTAGIAPSFTAKRRIAPPLPGLNVAFAGYKVNAAQGGTISHSTGSKLVIPANAFVDANGNAVSGNVEVRYREFRNPVDVFLAGIPMQYDSAGKTFQFESAGMMEVAAFAGGKVVYLDKNKPVEVQFASKQAGTQFSVYEFDTAQGNWAYRGEDAIRPKEQGAPVSRLSEKEKQQAKTIADKTLSQELMASLSENPVPDAPSMPKKADKRRNRFTVDFSLKEFPEMAGYQNVLWEVDESGQRFDAATIYGTTWESMTLSKGAREGRYVVTFKKGIVTSTADVYPVLEGQSYENALKAYEQKYAGYVAARAKLEAAQAEARARYEKTLADLGLNGTNNVAQGAGNAHDVMRVFSISHFGLYNCDQPQMLPQGAVVSLSCKDQNGASLSGFTLYHVDRRKFCLYSYQDANPVSEFHFNPKSSNLVWAVKDGVLYTAEKDQFSAMPENGNTELTLTPVSRTFRSAEDMRVFFGIPASI